MTAKRTDEHTRSGLPATPITQRTVRELGYAALSLPWAVVGFCCATVVLLLSNMRLPGSIVLSSIVLAVIGIVALTVRAAGVATRRSARTMLKVPVEIPGVFPANPYLPGEPAVHAAGWRARLYHLIKIPITVANYVTVIGIINAGIAGLSYPVFRPVLTCTGISPAGHGCHQGLRISDSYYLDTVPRIAMVCASGLCLLLLSPWIVHGLVLLDRSLATALLRPSTAAARVRELEQRRATVIDESVATLRRIERDLHDGTQARLVALAMNIGLASAKLDEYDSDGARQLLRTADRTAKDALIELRDIVRGIHPPALDNGLDSALATLAARSTVPVQFSTDIPARASPAIEAIAYYCAAELLANVAKHSGAKHAVLSARTSSDHVELRLHDDGRGGATIGGGSGLAGLVERVSAVDGALTVNSPAGGPTLVSILLPLHS